MKNEDLQCLMIALSNYALDIARRERLGLKYDNIRAEENFHSIVEEINNEFKKRKDAE